MRDQYRAGTSVDLDDVEAGDLLFFETVSRGASHVGMAVGGGQFVHAPSSRGVVRVERYDASYWARRFVGARRVVAAGSPLTGGGPPGTVARLLLGDSQTSAVRRPDAHGSDASALCASLRASTTLRIVRASSSENCQSSGVFRRNSD